MIHDKSIEADVAQLQSSSEGSNAGCINRVLPKLMSTHFTHQIPIEMMSYTTMCVCVKFVSLTG